MSALRKHFEQRAAELADLSTLVTVEDGYSTRLTVAPRRPDAIGVVLYRFNGVVGTVPFDDQASVPAELGDDLGEDLRAIDGFIEEARDGRDRVPYRSRWLHRGPRRQREALQIVEELCSTPGLATSSRTR